MSHSDLYPTCDALLAKIREQELSLKLASEDLAQLRRDYAEQAEKVRALGEAGTAVANRLIAVDCCTVQSQIVLRNWSMTTSQIGWPREMPKDTPCQK